MKYNVYVEFGPFEIGEVEADCEKQALQLGMDIEIDDSEQFLNNPIYNIEKVEDDK